MAKAIELASKNGVPFGPNPRVGCVLLSPDGQVIAEGYHRGAGTAHAEADALARAGVAARGSTAVVTLEPCNHTGRTGPCAQALIAAGVRKVVLAQSDPTELAAGGATALRAAGLDVTTGVLEAEASRINRAWAFGLRHNRPFVTWKFAASLDGRSAAADGTSKWISNEAARQDAHRLRAESDVMLIGTGTVLADNPALTVRDERGQLLADQPLRVVMGERTLDQRLRIFGDEAQTLHLRTREPASVLSDLFALGRRHVFLEGGPAIAASFVKAGLVDEVVTYVAPVLLGSGAAAVGELGIQTINTALRLNISDVTVIASANGEQPNVRFTATTQI